jgi:hypothetical protein
MVVEQNILFEETQDLVFRQSLNHGLCVVQQARPQLSVSPLNVPPGGLTSIVGAQKWGGFLKNTEATPCGHLLKWELTPKTRCGCLVHGGHGHGSPVKNRWKIFTLSWNRELYETLTFTLKICILQKVGFNELKLVLFESLFQGLQILFYNIFGQTIYWSTAKPWTSPKKSSNGLERSKFRQQVQSFACVHPWRRVTFKFWEMLKNASEVTLVSKTIFSCKIWTLC